MRAKIKKGRLGEWTDWYELRRGSYYSDNYNETLGDSKIHIDHLTEKLDLQPFDIVKIELYGERVEYGVIDNIQVNQVGFNPNIYNYDIDLIEPTKLLENYVVPAYTYTARSDETTTIADFASKILNAVFFTFTQAKVKHNKNIPFIFSLPDALKVQVSEITISSESTLRECLTDLFMQVDYLPYITTFNEDTLQWTIGARNINTTGEEVSDKSNINYIQESYSSSDYVSELQVDMKNATQSENITPAIGYRNSKRYVMSTYDLAFETAYPIWDVNDFYVVIYVKKIGYRVLGAKYDETSGTQYVNVFGVDINSFFKISLKKFISEYGVWSTKDVKYGGFGDTAKLDATYRNSSLFFVRGQKDIKNFERYQEWKDLYISNQGKWVWEMILNYFNNDGLEEIKASLSEDIQKQLDEQYKLAQEKCEDLSQSGFQDIELSKLNSWYYSDKSGSGFWYKYEYSYKECGFYLDYVPLYNASFRASKYPYSRNVKEVIDNQSTELVNAQKLSLLEYLKANRLGNKMKIINARYKSSDYDKIPALADKINDSIIFKRELTIYEDYIDANYLATDNYILRDYYTGVRSRARSYKTTINEDVEKNIIIKYLIGTNAGKNQDITDSNGNAFKINGCVDSIDTFYNNIKDKILLIKTNIATDYYYYIEPTLTKTDKTILLSFKFKDNATLGTYISNESGTGGMEQKDYKYTNDYGECESVEMILYDKQTPSSADDYKADAQQYPKCRYTITPANAVFRSTYTYKKDNKECMHITLQFEWDNDTTNAQVIRVL